MKWISIATITSANVVAIAVNPHRMYECVCDVCGVCGVVWCMQVTGGVCHHRR